MFRPTLLPSPILATPSRRHLPTLRILPFSLRLPHVSPRSLIISLPLALSFSRTSFSFLQHISESCFSPFNVIKLSLSLMKASSFHHAPFIGRTLILLAFSVIFFSRSFSVSLSSSRLNFSLLSRPNTWPKHESVSLLPSSLLLAYSCPSSVYQPHYYTTFDYSRSSPILA